MLLARGKGEDWEALATAALISPAPGFWPMWRRAGWLRKREEGRPPPWPPEAPSMTLLPPSRLERGSWPPLAARAERGEKRLKTLKFDSKRAEMLLFIFNKSDKNIKTKRNQVRVCHHHLRTVHVMCDQRTQQKMVIKYNPTQGTATGNTSGLLSWKHADDWPWLVFHMGLPLCRWGPRKSAI